MFHHFDHERAEQIGRFLRAARVSSGEILAVTAARCVPKISAARLSFLERGRAPIRPAELRALTSALPLLGQLLATLPPVVPRKLRGRGVPAGRYAAGNTSSSEAR